MRAAHRVILPCLCAWSAACLANERPADGEERLASAQPAPLTPAAPSAPGAGSAHCADHPPLPAADPLPGRSLYHLRATLTDQLGATRALDSFRGEPLLVTMFYASCTSVCPLLIGQLQRIEQALPETARARARVLLISLAPERDSVAALLALSARHGADARRWSFVRTPESSVRELAALLGIRYRRLDGGEISHSPVIALLDREGVIVARGEGTLPAPDELASALAKLLASAGGA